MLIRKWKNFIANGKEWELENLDSFFFIRVTVDESEL